jgi:hypothetical protein
MSAKVSLLVIVSSQSVNIHNFGLDLDMVQCQLQFNQAVTNVQLNKTRGFRNWIGLRSKFGEFEIEPVPIGSALD